MSTASSGSTSMPQLTAEAGAAGTDSEDPLPPGWSMSRTEGGRPFYIDHDKRTTTWVIQIVGLISLLGLSG